MIRKFFGILLIIALGYGAIVWLGEPGNGKQLGDAGGQVAGDAVDGVGGAGDVISGFINGLTR